MTKAVIVDLDGTLADCEHRQHYVQNGRKNWKLFFDHMHLDAVNQNLNELLLTLHQFYDIYFVSARPDNYRDVTVAWLKDAGWDINDEDINLIMRKDGDFRADTIVKQEIFDANFKDKEIIMAFDDRKSVVDMWRKNGVTCSQVADHNF